MEPRRYRGRLKDMRSIQCLRASALTLVVLAACGSEPADRDTVGSAPVTTAVPSTTAQPGTTASPATSASAATTASPGTTASPVTTLPAIAPTTAPGARTPTSLGPEWRQEGGRVLIEATASGDARVLLRDLEALGLREGVVFGRLVNGWLPVESFAAAQRLDSLAFVRPTGAGTG